jgi:DNA mismatch repair protein MutH
MNSLFDLLFALLFTLLILAFALSMALGVNMKKWYGWLQVLSGFLLGSLMGSPTTQDLAGRIILGIFFGVITMWLGPIAWRRRHPNL